jgi:hypothetical protein
MRKAVQETNAIKARKERVQWEPSKLMKIV